MQCFNNINLTLNTLEKIGRWHENRLKLISKEVLQKEMQSRYFAVIIHFYEMQMLNTQIEIETRS